MRNVLLILALIFGLNFTGRAAELELGMKDGLTTEGVICSSDLILKTDTKPNDSVDETSVIQN